MAQRRIVLLHENGWSKAWCGRGFLLSKNIPTLSLRRTERQGRGTPIGCSRFSALFGCVHPEKVHDALRRIQKNDASAQDNASPIARQAWQTSGADAGQRLNFFLQA